MGIRRPPGAAGPEPHSTCPCSPAGRPEPVEETQVPKDVSEGEMDSMRPGEEDIDAAQEGGPEYSREEVRDADNADQGEQALRG